MRRGYEEDERSYSSRGRGSPGARVSGGREVLAGSTGLVEAGRDVAGGSVVVDESSEGSIVYRDALFVVDASQSERPLPSEPRSDHGQRSSAYEGGRTG